jgi:hypothetical protein
MIQAGIPVVATVQVEETTARHVKVIAVDITGNKSAASTAASATALLIDDAHISDLTVTKVTAGTVSANWLLAASIRTAASGARVELNAAGLQAYNAGGTQTVSIASADGSVTLLGQIISGTSGRRMEIMPTATFLPEIRMYANTGANFGYINVSSTGTDANIGVNGGTYDDGGVTVYARALLTSATSQIAVVRDDTQARRGAYSHYSVNQFSAGYNSGGTDGGTFTASSTQAKIGWDAGTASTANYMNFSSNRTRQIGRWSDYAVPDTNEGIFTGSVAGTSSANSLSLTYGATMLTQLLPIVSIRDAPSVANTRGFVVSAADTAGFTVQLSGAADGAWSIYFWCFPNLKGDPCGRGTCPDRGRGANVGQRNAMLDGHLPAGRRQKHGHVFPQSTLEWRMAEYGLDSIDEALDVVLHEPWAITPSEAWLIPADAATRQGMVTRTKGSAVDYEPIQLHNADSIDDAREAHRMRIADAKTRVHIVKPKGKTDPLDAIRARHGVTDDGSARRPPSLMQSGAPTAADSLSPSPTSSSTPKPAAAPAPRRQSCPRSRSSCPSRSASSPSEASSAGGARAAGRRLARPPAGAGSVRAEASPARLPARRRGLRGRGSWCRGRRTSCATHRPRLRS